MSKGGYRPGSGRKKGSIPWNVGKPMSEASKLKLSLAKKGVPAWNKGKEMSEEMKLKMNGNKNGSGNKGRVFGRKTLMKMREAKIRFFRKKYPKYQLRKRNQRIADNGGFHTNGEWEILKAQYNWTCPCCKKEKPQVKLTRDHIVPLLAGGSNNIENIQPLCHRCNRIKYTQTIRY